MRYRLKGVKYGIDGNVIDPDFESEKKNPKGQEKKVFEFIWSTREHVSFISGNNVPGEPSNFAHVLPKAQNKYPKFKLLAMGIVLLTRREHYLFDFERHKIEEDPILMKKWEKMFILEEHLKWLYGVMFD